MKIFKKIISFVVFCSLIFTSFSGVFATESKSLDFQKKIEELKDYKDDDFVDAIIKLKKQVDVSKIKDAVKKENVNASKEEIQNEIRKEMVDKSIKLKEDSQKSIIEILERSKKDGNVKNYQQFFIINCINVVCKKEVLVKISKRSDVEKISINKKVKIPKLQNNIPEDREALSSVEKKHVPWNLKMISADKAQKEVQNFNNDVVVAIIDSGVDVSHPAIKNNYRGNDKNLKRYSWYNVVNEKTGDKEEPYDDRGHGTHVCGTILGQRENSLLGVCPYAKWIAVKVFDSNGETDNAKLLKAGEWIMAPKDENGISHPEMAPKVVNNSWGGNSTDGFYQDMVKKWRDAGIFPVFSAGNVSQFNDGGDNSIGTPASYPQAYAVGAIRKDEIVAKFSLRGKSDYTENFKPDIVAPGVNILSSIPGGKYTIYTGTSMASPHVTGVVCLMLKANPDLSVDQIEKILNETATPLKDDYYTTSPNHGYGYGKVDALNAVKLSIGQKKGKDIDTSNMKVLSGRIITNGTDNEKPIINHSSMNKIFTTYKTTFDANVKDNIGIESVKLYLNINNEYKPYDMKLKNGNNLSGYYSVNIPVATFKNVTNGKYYIEATDINKKVTKSDEFSFEVQQGIGIGYVQDFEKDLSGFEVGGQSKLFKWGNIKKDEPNKKLIGIEAYKNIRGNSIFVMPPIDLTNETQNPALSFKHFYDLGNYESAFFDTAEVWIAEAKEDSDPDSLDWKLKRSYKNSSKEKWLDEYIDLSSYKGKKICVMFGFRPNGEYKSSGNGWYIDDIKIEQASKEIPETPSKYLKLNDKKDGKLIYTFSPVGNEKITSYELYRATNENGPFELIKTVEKGDSKNGFGKYSIDLVDIPKPQKGTYYYYAVAKIGENKSEPSQILSHTFTKGKEFKSFDFEKGQDGWTSIESDKETKWDFGKLEYADQYNTNYKKPTINQSLGKNDGMNVWATNLNDYRKPNTKYSLESPSMDLSTLKDATLYYQNWFSSSAKRRSDDYDSYNQDIGEVYFSKDDGKTWDKVYTFDESEVDKHIKWSWFTNGIEISKEYLTDKFKVKFVLDTGSDSGKTDPEQCGGWYIDDVTINTKDTKNNNIIEKVSPFKLLNMQSLNEENQEKDIIPLVGKITIKENEKTVMTEVGTGKFSIKLPAGKYTVVASAEGYKDKEEVIDLIEDVNKDFYLDTFKKASISVNVKDANYDSIQGNVKLYKEGKLEAIAEKDGETVRFTDLTSGNYTLVATSDGYKRLEKNIKIPGTGTVTLSLEKVYSENQLNVGYTDIKTENLSGMDLKDRAFANKISNDKLVDIKEISYFITKTKDVDLTNSKYRISIYDKNTQDELPGNILFSKDLTFEKEGWNKVAISNVQVNGDYYIAFTKLDGEIALGMDDSKDGINSFQMFNGAWDEPETKGIYMIGAKVITLSENEVQQATITFDKNGGSGEMQAVKLKINENYKLPQCTFTAPENKEFYCWQVEGENKNVSDDIVVNKDLTIQAIWRDKKNENPQMEKTDPVMPNPLLATASVTDFTHFITYSNDNKSDEYLKSVQKVIVNHKGKISEITDVKGIDSTDFTSNPNKKLQFSYTEKLDKNDTITIVSSKYKNVIVKITMDNLVGNDVYYSISANVEGEKILYRVTFDKNGGSGEMKDVEVENGGIFVVPKCDFTAPSGMEFDSWEYLNEKTEIGHKYQISKNIILKALWKEKLSEQATITFDKNGGLGTMQEVKKLLKEEYELPVCEFLPPEKMEFDAWEIDGQRHLPGEKVSLQKNNTIKALWIKDDKSKEPKEPLFSEILSENPSINKIDYKHLIGYKKEDSEYVNKINLITIRRNGKEIKHYLFTKEDGKYKNLDKTFDKVSIVFNDKTFFNRDDEIIISARGYKDLKLHIISVDDMVMNALYTTEIVSTVKFETFLGSKIDDQIIKVNQLSTNKLAKVQDPTKDGYTFKGWYEDSDFTKEFDFNKKIITDTTIFAKWVKNTPSEEKNIELEVKNVTIHQQDTLDLKSLIVKAKDDKNNDLKEQVEIIDEGGFNKDKVGTYTITFKLTNKNVSVTKKATVTVVEKENSTVNPEKPQEDKWVQNDDGTWTYQSVDGKVAVKDSWKLINDEWYRFDKDGKMVSNQWFEENGRWYYIEPNGTMSKNEWIIINGEWYYANADGRISQNEWVLVDGNWYFANASGRIADGEWFIVGGKWYYAEKGGLIAQGKTLKINNVNYTFDSNGVLVK